MIGQWRPGRSDEGSKRVWGWTSGLDLCRQQPDVDGVEQRVAGTSGEDRGRREGGGALVLGRAPPTTAAARASRPRTSLPGPCSGLFSSQRTVQWGVRERIRRRPRRDLTASAPCMAGDGHGIVTRSLVHPLNYSLIPSSTSTLQSPHVDLHVRSDDSMKAARRRRRRRRRRDGDGRGTPVAMLVPLRKLRRPKGECRAADTTHERGPPNGQFVSCSAAVCKRSVSAGANVAYE